MTVLQTGPAAGSPLAYAGTFALALAFYALTAHVAARWVIGRTPLERAVLVGIAPAVVTFFTLRVQPLGPAVVVPIAVSADAIAIRLVYGESPRVTAIFTLVHVLVSVALGLALVNLVQLTF